MVSFDLKGVIAFRDDFIVPDCFHRLQIKAFNNFNTLHFKITAADYRFLSAGGQVMDFIILLTYGKAQAPPEGREMLIPGAPLLSSTPSGPIKSLPAG